MSSDELDQNKGVCKVCQGPAAGLYFGAIVCLPCKSFYIRCTKDGVKLRCQQDTAACTINKGRFKCQACRFKACIAAGMHRKEEKPEVMNAPEGASLCKVCGDIANGVHFGVTSCEGCKKFFRRGLTESQNYNCKDGGQCPINPRTRNQCRYCRYQACINAGMSREAIKVGRPPSKKENSRHHPYGQINLSTNHMDSSPKLYTNHHNGFMKTELPWMTSENNSLASLPAIIHGGNNMRYSPQQSGKRFNEYGTVDLNSSCTSAEINDMLLNYMDPNNEIAPLPDNFDLEETFAKIDSPSEPRVGQKPNRLQRIENLPHQHHQLQQGQYQHPALALIAAQNKINFHLQPIKTESSTAYREPVNTYSHPSPPYDASYDQYGSPPSLYHNYNSPQQTNSVPQQKHAANINYNQAMANQNSQNAARSPHYVGGDLSPQRRQAFEMSPGSQTSFDPLCTNLNGVTEFTDIRHQRHSCDRNSQHLAQQDLSNPYAQPNMSPYSLTSCASSPQSSANGTSGYATDSQDCLDEYSVSIYDPLDIQQVNYKYMPSCSYQPLVFNEEALTVEDLWSGKGNQTTESSKKTEKKKEKEIQTEGTGMFKRMKSIDDKVQQNYWFEHDMPEVEYSPELKERMEDLKTGWMKCKSYIGSNLRSGNDDGKESHWPNVKENAPLQLKMWEFIKHRLLRGTQAQVMFYQQIKGSEKVPEKDQKTLVSTASFSNCLLINILYWWDEERDQCRYFWSWKVPPSDPFYVFRQTLLKFSRAIRDLNFDENEIMLVSALTLFSSDIIQIEKKDVIDRERTQLSNLCAAYMKDKYKDKYKERYRDMLAMVPALRYLAIWHQDLMAFAKTFGSVGLNLDKMRISES